ncbi:hypothetical protein BRADI_1g27394v3 [Brachypodium distachyon]|uniref:Uncharacterized protein n=1 Tax=Brachypodium distachyon TaxID=15368 RepID=A0A2K2DLB8_BRADI|nr:hypothetical protein BRADI_1g27394v3 [Brachypodium distachyon]
MHCMIGRSKTLITKANEDHNIVAFIGLSGSEFVHEHPVKEPRMVEVFQVAHDDMLATFLLQGGHGAGQQVAAGAAHRNLEGCGTTNRGRMNC